MHITILKGRRSRASQQTFATALALVCFLAAVFMSSASWAEVPPILVYLDGTTSPPSANVVASTGRPRSDHIMLAEDSPTLDPTKVELRGLSWLVDQSAPVELTFKEEACSNIPPGVTSLRCYSVDFPELAGPKGELRFNLAVDGNTFSKDEPVSLATSGHQPAPPGTPATAGLNGTPPSGAAEGFCNYADPRNTFHECALREVLGADSEGYKEYKDMPQNVYLRGDNRAVLFYDTDGDALYQIPKIDENDRVTIVIVPAGDETIREVRPTVCAERPGLRIKKTVRPVSFAAGSMPKPARRVDVDQCSADDGIKVSVTSDDGQNTQTQQIEIDTLPVYNFILSLGLVYDFSLETDFITRTPKGATVPQIVADEHVRGLQSPILVLGYHFWAVDAERPRRGTDFVPSPFLGFSFTEPLEHLYFGIVFEPFPGLGTLLGYHAFEEETLAGGYDVGDSFPSGDVPTNQRWTLDARNIVLGLNVDSEVFGSILKALKGK